MKHSTFAAGPTDITMDMGTLHESTFTLFDKHSCRNRVRTVHLLTKTQGKVMLARTAREHLLSQLRAREDRYCSLFEAGRAPAAASVVASIASLQTMLHLVERYILLLLRDCLRLESCLRGPIEDAHWRRWRSSVRELTQRTPNVHDYFLWELSQDPASPSSAGRAEDITNDLILLRTSQ